MSGKEEIGGYVKIKSFPKLISFNIKKFTMEIGKTFFKAGISVSSP